VTRIEDMDLGFGQFTLERRNLADLEGRIYLSHRTRVGGWRRLRQAPQAVVNVKPSLSLDQVQPAPRPSIWTIKRRALSV
jgi:hypothetical protein